MKRMMAAVVALFALSQAVPVPAEDTFSFQLSGGGVYNFRMPMTIRQDGQETIRHTAGFDTKPFDTPAYWAIRAGWWRGDAAWEAELVHHKLYLNNNPPEIQHFSVSHGFNLLTVNRAWRHPWFIWRIGLGVVISHPESTVRGAEFDQQGGIADGYYLSGPTGQLSLEKRIPLWKGLFASLEGKLTVSWARVPIQNGDADILNTALHGLIGLGYEF